MARIINYLEKEVFIGGKNIELLDIYKKDIGLIQRATDFGSSSFSDMRK